jgi:hypothetical protein
MEERFPFEDIGAGHGERINEVSPVCGESIRVHCGSGEACRKDCDGQDNAISHKYLMCNEKSKQDQSKNKPSM